MNSKAKKLILGLLLCAMASQAENPFSLGNNRVFLHDFKANGVLHLKDKEETTPEKQLSTWNISGEKAIVQGEQYQLSGFEMQIDNPLRGRVTLLSPHCDFDRLEQEIKSNAAVMMQAEGMQISGLGYDVYQQNGKVMLVIRSTVQIHFQKEQIKRLRGDGS
jgi:hypothetical protein